MPITLALRNPDTDLRPFTTFSALHFSCFSHFSSAELMVLQLKWGSAVNTPFQDFCFNWFFGFSLSFSPSLSLSLSPNLIFLISPYSWHVFCKVWYSRMEVLIALHYSCWEIIRQSSGHSSEGNSPFRKIFLPVIHALLCHCDASQCGFFYYLPCWEFTWNFESMNGCISSFPGNPQL